MPQDAAYWIRTLGLVPHPEGGRFRETWRSPHRTDRDRDLGSAIYFLLEGKDFSAFHRLASDEIWHFYAGDPLTVTMITGSGSISRSRVGSNPEEGEAPQVIVPSGVWFAASLDREDGFALVGCTTSPGFDYADWEIADRGALVSAFPQHQDTIVRLTHPAR